MNKGSQGAEQFIGPRGVGTPSDFPFFVVFKKTSGWRG